MKQMMALGLTLALIAGNVLAGENKVSDAKSTAKHAQIEYFNNVVRMDGSGQRTAICACGKEFVVTNEDLSLHRGNETDYCCSEGCHAMALKIPAAEMDQAMIDYWHKFPLQRTLNTAMKKDGKTTATCFCGNTVNVTAASPWVLENGVIVYPCSEACVTAIHHMTSAERLQVEQKFVQTASAH